MPARCEVRGRQLQLRAGAAADGARGVGRYQRPVGGATSSRRTSAFCMAPSCGRMHRKAAADKEEEEERAAEAPTTAD
ncbi:hypothetical protein ABZP36_024016 [Zizania latifolia]